MRNPNMDNIVPDHVKPSSFIGVLLILVAVLGVDAILIAVNWL